MKLNIPFYKQESKNDCGPTALQMVLEYLGEKYSKKKLINLVDSDKSGTTWTLGLAVAAAKLGFQAEFYSKHIGFNPENYELEFYKKETDGMDSNKLKLEKLKLEADKLKVKIQEKIFTLNELLSKISESSVAIILLDWSKIKQTDSFMGHFVPIVGYDDENILVHNQGFHNSGEFIKINKNLFDEARKSKGTDEDIVYIYRK